MRDSRSPARQKNKLFRFDYFFSLSAISCILIEPNSEQVYMLLKICSYSARSTKQDNSCSSTLNNGIIYPAASAVAAYVKCSLHEWNASYREQYCVRFVEHCHQTIKMSTTAEIRCEKIAVKIKCKVIKSKSFRITIFAWKTRVH